MAPAGQRLAAQRNLPDQALLVLADALAVIDVARGVDQHVEPLPGLGRDLDLGFLQAPVEHADPAAAD